MAAQGGIHLAEEITKGLNCDRPPHLEPRVSLGEHCVVMLGIAPQIEWALVVAQVHSATTSSRYQAGISTLGIVHRKLTRSRSDAAKAGTGLQWSRARRSQLMLAARARALGKIMISPGSRKKIKGFWSQLEKLK